MPFLDLIRVLLKLSQLSLTRLGQEYFALEARLLKGLVSFRHPSGLLTVWHTGCGTRKDMDVSGQLHTEGLCGCQQPLE